MHDDASHALATELAERVIERYTKGEIDSVYVLFNEFKSVIQQRLVVERVLPIVEIGVADVQQTRELTVKEREEAQKAAISAGVGMRSTQGREFDEAAAKFGTAQVDYIYEQSPAELFRDLLPKYVGIQIFHADQTGGRRGRGHNGQWHCPGVFACWLSGDSI